jgi:hypothetical protein
VSGEYSRGVYIGKSPPLPRWGRGILAGVTCKGNIKRGRERRNTKGKERGKYARKDKK